jgi:hypothetical protein
VSAGIFVKFGLGQTQILAPSRCLENITLHVSHLLHLGLRAIKYLLLLHTTLFQFTAEDQMRLLAFRLGRLGLDLL